MNLAAMLRLYRESDERKRLLSVTPGPREWGCAHLFGTFFDTANLFEQSVLHLGRLSFAARNPADVRRIDAQLSGDTAVDATVKAESIQLGIFGMILCHDS